MSQFAALAALGLNPGDSVASARVRNYCLVAAPANAATIAPGGNATARIKTDGIGPFVVASLVGSAKLGSVIGASVIGTPLPADTDPDDAANTMAFLDHIRYEIRVSGNPMHQAPRKLGHLAKRGNDVYTPPAPFVVDAQTDIDITFFNDHPTASITPQIELDGYYDPRVIGSNQ